MNKWKAFVQGQVQARQSAELAGYIPRDRPGRRPHRVRWRRCTPGDLRAFLRRLAKRRRRKGYKVTRKAHRGVEVK